MRMHAPGTRSQSKILMTTRRDGKRIVLIVLLKYILNEINCDQLYTAIRAMVILPPDFLKRNHLRWLPTLSTV